MAMFSWEMKNASSFIKKRFFAGKSFYACQLWKLHCIIETDHLHVLNIATKRMHGLDQTFMIWHKRLGRISKERVFQLSKMNMIPEIDFKNAIECVD